MHNATSLMILIETFKDKIEILLESKNNDGETALHLAAIYNPDSLQFLVKMLGERVLEVKDHDGRTALHFAALFNPDSLELLIAAFREKVLEVKNNESFHN